MDRKLVDLPKFLVFNSGTRSVRNNSIFALSLLMFVYSSSSFKTMYDNQAYE
jgi:hypothetical protein